MKVLATFSFLLLFHGAFCQLHFEADTTSYYDRISGDIDTVDASNSFTNGTFDGGICYTCYNELPARVLFYQYFKRQFTDVIQYDQIRFSALPHMGFAYSFGGQGSQFLSLKYSQAFSDRILFNLDYDRSAATGYLRNSNYGLNSLRTSLQKRGDRHSLKLFGTYQNNLVHHPAGITTDSLIQDFGLEFTPVNKTNAFSTNKQGHILLENYLSFNKDSVNQLGILIRNEFLIRNREYYEEDTLYGIYSVINFDSLSTRDQYNVAQLENGVGAYFQRRNIYVDGTVNHVYWDYQNLGVHTDTTELNIRSRFKLRVKNLTLTNQLYLNLQGRFNEWKNRSNIYWSSERLELIGGVELGAIAPEPTLRNFYGNHLDYQLFGITNQTYLRADGSFIYGIVDSMLNLIARGMYATISNPYTFDGSSYRNDSIQGINLMSIEPGLEFRINGFRLYTSAAFSTDNAGYLPSVKVRVRPQLVGRAFKAKKLEYSIGAEFTYCSSYNMRSYIPLVDQYDFYGQGITNSNVTNLNAFLALGIEEFKFFLKYENVGYFWNDQTLQVMQSYPLAGPRFRIGITWDFFN